VNPPSLFADPQAGFILVDHLRFDQRRFEAAFHLAQLLVASVDKASDAARRELDSQQLVE
jgi:hypothetical protein